MCSIAQGACKNPQNHNSEKQTNRAASTTNKREQKAEVLTDGQIMRRAEADAGPNQEFKVGVEEEDYMGRVKKKKLAFVRNPSSTARNHNNSN